MHTAVRSSAHVPALATDVLLTPPKALPWVPDRESTPSALTGAAVDVDVDAIPEHAAWARALRRTIDIVLSLTAIVLLAPLLIVLAVLVKRSSPGPIIFRQTRMGRGGRHFTVYKFRSMRDGAHDEVLQNEALRAAYRKNDFKLDGNDPRITPFGSLLRKSSLDELPQLFNVLKGDMSIVGIRPLLFEEVGLRPIYDQQLYTLMRPGMTGLWQVEGRSNVGRQDRIELDRRYVERWSVGADLKIIARTPLAVVRTAETC